MFAIGAGVLLFLAGAVVQVAGVRSGAYSRGGSLRGRLRYGLPAVAFFMAAALLIMIGGFQRMA